MIYDEKNDRAVLKELLGELLSELIGEAQEETEEFELDYEFEDKHGLIAVAVFNETISDFIRHIDAILDEFDYKMSLANAYYILAELIGFAISTGVIIDKIEVWEDVEALFRNRASEFSGQGSEDNLAGVSFDPTRWTGTIDALTRHVHYGMTKYEDDGLSADEAVLLFRSAFITARNRGMIDYSQQWARDLMVTLDEDWRLLGGGFAPGMGTGNPPFSYGG